MKSSSSFTISLASGVLVTVLGFILLKDDNSVSEIATSAKVNGAGEQTEKVNGPPPKNLVAADNSEGINSVRSPKTSKDRLDPAVNVVPTPVEQKEPTPIQALVSEQELENALKKLALEQEQQGRAEGGDLTFFKANDDVEFYEGEAEFYNQATLGELTELSESGDAKAMQKLSELARQAGRWLEAEQYAIAAAQESGSLDPLTRLALERNIQSNPPWSDRTAASLFLAAYLQGDASSAFFVQNYMAYLDSPDQEWAVVRAQEILEQFAEGG